MGKTNPPFLLFQSPAQKFAYFLATWFGSGLSSRGPGTVGSIAALPLIYFLNLTLNNDLQRYGFWLAFAFVAIWSSQVFCEVTAQKDHQSIVIDEVLGMGIATLSAQNDWKTLLIAFILFRIFDICKFPPVRQIDRWSKAKHSLPYQAGMGVVFDDVVAGFQALISIWVMLILLNNYI